MALPPRKLLLLAVLLISAAALSYQILLVRLLAIMQSHQAASLLISLALLGYGGSGAFLSRCRQVLLPAYGSVFTVNAALFGLGAVVCFMLISRVPLNLLDLPGSAGEGVHLMLTAGLLLLPLFFAANCIGLTLQRYPDGIGRIFAADLVGAGIGAVAVTALLFIFFPGRSLQIVAFVGLAAAIMGAAATRPQPRWVVTVTLLSLGLLFVFGQHSPRYGEPASSKALPRLSRLLQTQVLKERSSPLGLLTVIRSPAAPLHYAPGLSVTSRAVVPEQLAVFVDADRMTVINRWDGSADGTAYLDDVPSALPYHLLDSAPRVLVLGAGGGTPVLQALAHGAQRVDVVEPNPQIIDLARRNYGSFSGHLFDHPGIALHFADVRGFVHAVSTRYTLIQLSSFDDLLPAVSAFDAVPQDYVHTREALGAYLSRLGPGGFVVFTRWVRVPPRDGLKLMATAIAALERLGIPRPGARLAWIGNEQTATLLLKNGELTREDMHRIRRFCADRSFDVAYLPGAVDPAEISDRPLGQPQLKAAAALLATDRARFIREYPFDIEPVTDDRPYFADFSHRPLLIPTLLLTLLCGGLLIFAAVPAKGHSGHTDPDRPRRFRAAVYFGCLGLAFVFIEIVSIQRFTRYLAHPLYGIPVLLAAYLIFAALGSRWASRVPRRSARGRAALAAAATILLTMLHLTLVSSLLHTSLQWPTMAKIALVTASIAPLAVCMGALLPLGMTRLTYQDSALLPWAYAIKGCASAVAVALASLLALHFGQTAVLLLAMGLYALAARFVP